MPSSHATLHVAPLSENIFSTNSMLFHKWRGCYRHWRHPANYCVALRLEVSTNVVDLVATIFLKRCCFISGMIYRINAVPRFASRHQKGSPSNFFAIILVLNCDQCPWRMAGWRLGNLQSETPCRIFFGEPTKPRKQARNFCLRLLYSFMKAYYPSRAQQAGCGSFKREKTISQRKTLPIESFVATLIDWTFFWWLEQSWHLLALSQHATALDSKF